jgi:aconitate hydratase
MKNQMNVVEKILAAHLLEGDAAKDSELGIRIDQTLTQDATGTMAYLQFESMGVNRVKTDVSVSYVDHNTVQIGFENADDHDFLQSVAKRYGIIYSKAGNGICHQLHLERFGKPGTTLLGSDSHTPTGGGIGQIAIGAGGIDIAVAMAGGAFHIPTPKVRAIVLKGKLKKGVSAKDVILKVLEKFGTKGNVGWIFEYTGPGVATLDVPSRATITNMGAELGVTTSVFPSDKVTKQFLAAQGRAKDFVEILPDKGAKYDDTFTVDLSKLEPLMAAPHSPGNIVTVKSMKGRKVNQIMIGSCTNSSYRDIRTVALYLKGSMSPTMSKSASPAAQGRSSTCSRRTVRSEFSTVRAAVCSRTRADSASARTCRRERARSPSEQTTATLKAAAEQSRRAYTSYLPRRPPRRLLPARSNFLRLIPSRAFPVPRSSRSTIRCSFTAPRPVRA